MTYPSLALVPELDGPFAVTTLEDIATDTAFGPSASLIYVEGEVALYLDEDDVDIVLSDVTDRDLAIMEGLVRLAANRVANEKEIRRLASGEARRALYEQ